MEKLDDIENPQEERFRALHERVNKLDLAFRIISNELSARVRKLEKPASSPTRRQLSS